MFSGFQHDAITGGKSRSEFPRGHEKREIPGNDLADDTDGFAQSKSMKPRAGRIGNADWDGVPFDLGGPTCHVMKEVGRKRNIRHARDSARFAIIERFDFGEFIRVLEDQIANPPDEFAAFACRQAAPRAGFESAAGGGNRAVDVFFVALGYAGP